MSDLNRLTLFFHASKIDIQCEDRNLLQLLSHYFTHFLKPSKSEELKYFHQIDLYVKAESLRRPFYAIPFKRGYFWGWFSKRKVLYSDGSSLNLEVLSSQKKVLAISSMSSDHLKDLTFLMVQALWGEDMEREGFLRVHGLSYQSPKASGFISAGSGLGKSTTARKLAMDPSLEVLSDEIAWIKDAKLYSYPIPIWEKLPGGKKAHFLPEPSLNEGLLIKEIFCVFNRQEVSSISSFFLKPYFLARVVMGHHLPQMVEVFLRGNNLFFLAELFFRRLFNGYRYIFLGPTRCLVVEKYLDSERLSELSGIFGNSTCEDCREYF